MISAALALYEATAEKKYLDGALAWQAASIAITPMTITAAIISPPTTQKV